MSAKTAFWESSRIVVEAFLSSVVLVDDQANLGPRPDIPVPAKVVVPGRQGGTRTEVQIANPPQVGCGATEAGIAPLVEDQISGTTKITYEPDAAVRESFERSHAIDAKTVIDVFARVGVVCAVLRPEKEELEKLSELVMLVGANADVLILDWVLWDAKLGEMTLDLISRTVTLAAGSGRARLVLIYTAEPDLAEIEKQIRKALRLEEERPSNTLTISSGGTRICIYGKAGTLNAPLGDDRIKTPAELPEVVIAEFTEMTRGLLSNVAMKSITAIRAKTFQLLRRFDSNLDAPYVTQSALISPERAEEQLTSLIVSEIQEILEDENVGCLADFPKIIEWLDDQMANGLSLPETPSLTSTQYREGLVHLLRNGVGSKAIKILKQHHAQFAGSLIAEDEKEPAMPVRELLTGILKPNSPEAHQADEMLTMLMALRHRYTNPSPKLSLGTVIARTEDTKLKYLLCLQPLCDSVRIKTSHPFAFLSLRSVNDSKRCDLIVKDGQQLQFLKIRLNPVMLEMISFDPNQEEKVMAKAENEGFWFNSTTGITFKWIADLKPAHAQRVANNFAGMFSRVGVVESEWNRLGSKP